MINKVLDKVQKVEDTLTDRQIGIDIYKILCCFLITTIHLFGYSDFLSIEDINRTNFIVAGVISSANIVGTSGFIFITGYFLCESGTKVNIKRIVSFILQLNFISVSIFFVVLVLNGNFSATYLVNSFFPILSQHYWYPFNYIVLLLVSPFLNILVHNTTRKELAGIIVLLVCVIGVFLKINPFYTPSVFVGHYSHGFVWWGLLYLTAAYYRRYGVRHTTLCGAVLFFGCVFFGLLLLIGEKYVPVIGKSGLLEDDSIIGWLATTSSFIMLHQIKWREGKMVGRLMKYIVPSTFIVYILQEHNMVGKMLWQWVNISQYAQASVFQLIMVMILTFGAIWAVATILFLAYLIAKKIYIGKIETIFELIIRKVISKL